jgi:ABC-type uncharacterized transport system ATPase subunit
MRGITKRFANVVANEAVDLTIEPGQVHCLLGENGAGKTTLMNVLYGLYGATSGEIVVDGTVRTFASPADAIAAGIGMVHQHFMLVPVFTVLDNLILGNEPTGRLGAIDRSAARAEITELADRYGLEIDLDAVVEDLPVGVQQRVEILKALHRGADCLILDEPTAVLTPSEIEDLFRVVADLKADGTSIVFITHKLREILAIADTVTVLRGGRVVASADPKTVSQQDLATMMVGREVQLVVDRAPAKPQRAVLEVRGLRVAGTREQTVVEGVSFTVYAGEIVGIAGVQGNGQTELIEAITGMRAPSAGTVLLDGQDITGMRPASLFDLGVAHVPEDRHAHGMIGAFPVKDNLVLNTFRRASFANRLRVNRRAIAEQATQLVQDFDVRTPSIDEPITNLSGGNQQKVIVAREFTHAERLLIASQPTRGLDVGSIQYIHRRIVEKRDEGAGVLIVSTELDEVLALCDRILVMYGGALVGEVAGEQATREGLGLLMAGVSGQASA